jgi:hypothetical protein
MAYAATIEADEDWGPRDMDELVRAFRNLVAICTDAARRLDDPDMQMIGSLNGRIDVRPLDWCRAVIVDLDNGRAVQIDLMMMVLSSPDMIKPTAVILRDLGRAWGF